MVTVEKVKLYCGGCRTTKVMWMAGDSWVSKLGPWNEKVPFRCVSCTREAAR